MIHMGFHVSHASQVRDGWGWVGAGGGSVMRETHMLNPVRRILIAQIV